MEKPVICVVGLGYVGLPLAYTLAKKGYTVHGYDISEARIESLKSGHDWTNEITDNDLQTVDINYTTDPNCMSESKVIIMAIPTPVDEHKKPDLTPVKKSSETVGTYLKPGSIVVYESTVYPGTTEEICGPILEEHSGLTCGTDFTLGYSPERINPGDKEHTVDKIMKVVAGQDEATTDILCDLYRDVTTGGVHRAPNIKVAEMAKAIENAQRDLNIAFVNEVALLCHRIGITTQDVLEAAGTKWNFLKFQPGLVGGHCIGVDPYYLVEKAQQLGMETKVITAGRDTNDSMSSLVVDETLAALGNPASAKVLVMGLTFKEDIPDTRNSQSFAVIGDLQAKGCDVVVHDPQVSDDEWKRLGLKRGALADGPYDAILVLVKHKEYAMLSEESLNNALNNGGVLYDLKWLYDGTEIAKNGRTYLTL